MQISAESLQSIRVGFNAAYKSGLGQADTDYAKIAMKTTSATASNVYGWLGEVPGVRKWIGERVVNALAEHDYTIVNDDWEDTVRVKRNHIKDDNLGIYTPMFEMLGRGVAVHPDLQCFGALKSGFTNLCYDGQPYFDTDHPVLDENGEMYSVSNMQDGAGTPWFLLNTDRPVKPIIYQEREAFQFVALDSPNDPNVFYNKEFVYGVDGRNATGYGFWQMAYGSRAALNAENFGAAFAAMEGQKGDHGRPLGLKPNLLVVPPTHRQAAMELLNAERNEAGATNVWKGTVELLVTPWAA